MELWLTVPTMLANFESGFPTLASLLCAIWSVAIALSASRARFAALV
jgi:hypothetical protein